MIRNFRPTAWKSPLSTSPRRARTSRAGPADHGFASSHSINWVVRNGLDADESRARVIALDNRGHGKSGKPHDPGAYRLPTMARDAANLLDHLAIPKADVMGYSMGRVSPASRRGETPAACGP